MIVIRNTKFQSQNVMGKRDRRRLKTTKIDLKEVWDIKIWAGIKWARVGINGEPL
jgi:hypothetical protein